MSEYHSVECQLKVQYEANLLEALKKMGYHPKVYETAQNLEGYRGDQRSQQAHIVIARNEVGVASNDIGFLRKEDGTYLIHVSSYDSARWKKTFPELVKNYATSVVGDIVKNGPYQWDSQKTDDNGVTTIKLIVRDQ